MLMNRNDYKHQPTLVLFVFSLFLFGCHNKEGMHSSDDPPFTVLKEIPEGEGIIFIHKNDFSSEEARDTVRSMRPDGSQKEDLIRAHTSFANSFLLSQDRKKIVVGIWDSSGEVQVQDAHYDLSFTYLWLIEATKGLQLTGLREGNVDDSAEEWSKDGKTIFYTHQGGIRIGQVVGSILFDPWEIWATNIDGSNPRRIVDGTRASLSPDGNTLAVYRARPVEGENYSNLETIFVDPDGTNVRLFRNAVSDCEWAKSGIYLACLYLSNTEDNIALFNPNGDLIRKLTIGVRVRTLSWSPDEQWLVYEMSEGNGGSIWKIRVDGAGPPVRLTPAGERNFSPKWLP